MFVLNIKIENTKNADSDSGFTLIELLIVVAIIGILAAIAVPNFLNAMLRAKIANTQSDLRTMMDAMLQYHLDNNSYHAHRDGFGQQFPLTTPVPYLTGFLEDRFQDTAQVRGDGYEGAAAGFSASFTYYHWIPYNTHLDWWYISGRRGHPLVREAQRTKNGGIVDGWGPAGVRGGPPFDPSNGLRSLGGFFRRIPPGQAIHLYSQ